MALEMETDPWVQRLSGTDPERELAIKELSTLLHRGLTYSLSKKYGGGLQTEDVVQESLIKILKSLETFEGRSKFTTWAMTIATRVGISELRRKHTRNISLDAFTAGNELRFEFADERSTLVGEDLEKRRIIETLQSLIESKLSDKQKLAVRGLLEGMPVEVIAERTNSNRNAIYKLVHDARIKLRKGFEQSGIVAEDVSAIFA